MLVFSDTVQNCILPMEAVLYERNLRFVPDVHADVRVLGNRRELERLVRILMENAIQYTPGGGQITLSLRTVKRKAVLQVGNTGPGIGEKDLPHVFDRFYRGDAARSREGNSYGLGLSIAQEIVQQHRGTIMAESGDGLTTFTVSLPTG